MPAALYATSSITGTGLSLSFSVLESKGCAISPLSEAARVKAGGR